MLRCVAADMLDDEVGVLGRARAVALLEGRMAEVSRAVNAESARWGDIFASQFYGRPQWEAQTSWLHSTFFTQRGPIVRQQLTRLLGQLGGSDCAEILAAEGYTHFSGPTERVPAGASAECGLESLSALTGASCPAAAAGQMVPSACPAGCGAAIVPYWARCGASLRQQLGAEVAGAVTGFAALCRDGPPSAGGGH